MRSINDVLKFSTQDDAAAKRTKKQVYDAAYRKSENGKQITKKCYLARKESGRKAESNLQQKNSPAAIKWRKERREDRAQYGSAY